MKVVRRGIVTMVLLLFSVLTSLAQNVKGKVIDAKTKEPLIGAVIELR